MDLTPGQRAEADRLFAVLTKAAAADLRQLAELLAVKADRDLLGATELEVRDRVHRIGAKAIEAALAGRKKGATTAPAGAARAAGTRPSSSAGSPGGS
jgi:hypothetical protein